EAALRGPAGPAGLGARGGSAEGPAAAQDEEDHRAPGPAEPPVRRGPGARDHRRAHPRAPGLRGLGPAGPAGGAGPGVSPAAGAVRALARGGRPDLRGDGRRMSDGSTTERNIVLSVVVPTRNNRAGVVRLLE